MADEPRELVNFRLGRTEKEALYRLADEQDKPVGRLVREVVEEYLADHERKAWEAEARRTAARLGEEARDPSSQEAETLRLLDAESDELSSDWVWEGEDL